MYTKNDVKTDEHNHHFTPNTITYSTPKNSEEGKKISKAKMGVVVHTKYHGPTLEKMHAGFDPDTHNFKQHPDVHLISHEAPPAVHTPHNEANYEHHINSALETHRKAHVDTFHATSAHAGHIKTYINDTVKTGEKPSAAGLTSHITKKYHSEIAKLKTVKVKGQRQEELKAHVGHINKNKQHYETLFKIHNHLQKAKDSLVSSLESKPAYEHSIGGHKTGPEGFVITHHGHPSKLVNRAEFSKQNFLKNAR